jgi:hypothetical protein
MFYFARGQSPPRHDEAFGLRILLPRMHRQTPHWGKTDGTALVASPAPLAHLPESGPLRPLRPLRQAAAPSPASPPRAVPDPAPDAAGACLQGNTAPAGGLGRHSGGLIQRQGECV